MTRLIGNDPTDLGTLTIEGWDEFCFVQDMPVKLAGEPAVRVPHALSFASTFVAMVHAYLFEKYGDGWVNLRYLYLCAKHTIVDRGHTQTRPGWHTDGYGSDDLSFLWCDAVPTMFLKQAMRLPEDDELAMERMNALADTDNLERGLINRVYGMDDTVIHAPSQAHYVQPRRFLKLSVSRYPYNLAGNARNPLLPTPWEPTRERGTGRNCPEDKS